MIFRYLVVKGTQNIFHSKHGIMHNMICTNHASSKKFFVYNVIFFCKYYFAIYDFQSFNAYRLFVDSYRIGVSIMAHTNVFDMAWHENMTPYKKPDNV